MKKSFFYYVGITTGSALAIVAVIYAFNLLFLFPHLSGFLSPNEILFSEGLVILILGILIVSGAPHAVVVRGRRRLFMGSGGLTIDAGSHRNRPRNILALGFALMMASAILLLLYSLGIQ